MSTSSSQSATDVRQASSLGMLIVVTVLIGLIAGLGGMFLALLLHAIQHIAFGYDVGQLHGAKSFLQGVSGADAFRRVAVLGVCGLVAGVGWWIVRRFCKPLVSISQAVKGDDCRMPVVATVTHALLQIITVALGSPLGREVAPREFAAVFTGQLVHAAGLTREEARVMVACAAGAGLAAVYNVPLGGALFTLEVLLGTFRFSALLPALATSTIASMVAWIGLGDVSQYTLPRLAIAPSLLIWSIVTGPVFGGAAFVFSRASAAARRQAPRDRRLIPFCLVHFLILGALAIPFPELLGNGKGPVQLSLYSELSGGFAALLFLLKFYVITASLRVGAEGGLLTPGMTLGAMLATVTAGLWNLVFPPIAPADFALIGAGAFLASSMKMPLTAIVLVFEFTRFEHDFFYPLLLAVSGSYATFLWLSQRSARQPARSSLAGKAAYMAGNQA